MHGENVEYLLRVHLGWNPWTTQSVLVDFLQFEPSYRRHPCHCDWPDISSRLTKFPSKRKRKRKDTVNLVPEQFLFLGIKEYFRKRFENMVSGFRTSKWDQLILSRGRCHTAETKKGSLSIFFVPLSIYFIIQSFFYIKKENHDTLPQHNQHIHKPKRTSKNTEYLSYLNSYKKKCIMKVSVVQWLYPVNTLNTLNTLLSAPWI